MFDPDEIPLSTAEGRRPASTSGDRLMVGLAIIALLGGVLIAIGRLLPEAPPQTSQATATPVESVIPASRTPRPSPSPRPPRTTLVEEGPIPQITPDEQFFGGWVRLRDKVAVHSSPTTASNITNTLHRGSAAYLYAAPDEEGGEPGWLQVQAPGDGGGWIEADPDDEGLFDRFDYHGASPGSLYKLAAGPGGFVGIGNEADGTSLWLSSSDGAQWEAANVGSRYWDASMAYGPSGWVRINSAEDQTGKYRMFISQSGDGVDWEPMGAIPCCGTTWNGGELVGSELGYLTAQWGSSRPDFWYSTDGLLWTERRVPITNTDDGFRIAATALGFVAWTTRPENGAVEVAFSADGWTWSDEVFEEVARIVDVVADGDQLLMVGRTRGATHLWTGRSSGGDVVWAPADPSSIQEGVVTRVVNDGSRTILLGWDRETEEAVWWDRSLAGWQVHAFPSGFYGFPRLAVGSPAGIVAIGELAETNTSPVIWHLEESEWRSEASPAIAPPPPESPEACSRPRRTDVLELMTVDLAWAATCYGNRETTVRAWAVPCEGCYWDSGEDREPEWLASPSEADQLHLSPIANGDWGWLDAVLSPTLARREGWIGRWVEVTGHFNDAASSKCRWIPDYTQEDWYSGTADVVAECAARFVVTAVRPVNGP